MRLFFSYSLEKYPSIVSWLERLVQRPAYRKIIEIEKPETRGEFPTISAQAPVSILNGKRGE